MPSNSSPIQSAHPMQILKEMRDNGLHAEADKLQAQYNYWKENNEKIGQSTASESEQKALDSATAAAQQTQPQPNPYGYQISPSSQKLGLTIGQSTAQNAAAKVPAAVDEAQQKADIAAKEAGNKKLYEAQAQAKIDLPGQIASAEQLSNLTTELIDHPGLSGVVGMPNMWGLIPFPGTKEADFKARLDQIKGRSFLQAFDSLRGGGQITDVEGIKATNAIARLQSSQTEVEFKKSLKELDDITSGVTERLKKKAFSLGTSSKEENMPTKHTNSGWSIQEVK